MIAAFRAELVKLLRRRVLLITAAVAAVFAVGSAAVVLAAAEPAGARDGRAVTVASLADAGGGTEVFTTAVSFAGTFVFVVFVGVVAVEFARGTFRTMLLHQPRRVRLLAGKMAALLAFCAVALAAVAVVTWAAALVLAPSQDVATGAWTTRAALEGGLADYGATLLWVAGYAILGMTVAVLLRSVPVALAVGIAWAGPFEHLLEDAWEPAARVFPGLQLEAFVAGGTPDVSAARALAGVAVYVLVGAALSAVVVARRDVTS